MYWQGGTLTKFAERSGDADCRVNAIWRSETVGTEIYPGSFGEKEKMGVIVKWTKTRMRKVINTTKDV